MINFSSPSEKLIISPLKYKDRMSKMTTFKLTCKANLQLCCKSHSKVNLPLKFIGKMKLMRSVNMSKESYVPFIIDNNKVVPKLSKQ